MTRRSHLLAVTGAILAVGLLTSASAWGATAPRGTGGHDTGRVVPPTRTVDGLDGSDVMDEGWYIDLSLPEEVNPFFGNGDPCVKLGKKGKVLLALGPGPISCTVAQGTAVYVIGGTDFCDNVESPPFFGADERAQRDCALALLSVVTAITMTVDGGPPINLFAQRFETCSHQRRVQLLPDNFLGVPAQPATFTACGWVAWLEELPPGPHTIRTVTTTTDAEPRVRTLSVDIRRAKP